MRQFYVFNPKVINEQKCREDALKLLQEDEEPIVVIHKHKAGEQCTFDLLKIDNMHVQLPHIHALQCYEFTKETK
jgi:hypothetical protein